MLDINECVTKQHNCHNDAACVNDKGSWRCFCNQGYEGNGTFCQGKDSLVNVFMRNRIKK